MFNRPDPTLAQPVVEDHALSRRRLLVNAVALAAAASASRVWAESDDPIRLGQSVALTGPLAELGKAMHTGAKVCFEAVNARGGVNGRRVELIERDDGYDVKRSQENIKAFLREPNLFGLFGVMGTPMVEATLPLIRNTDVPCFAPLTGATSARPADMRNVFNVRASYPEEAERLIEHLATIGLKRIAVVYQNNSFGKEVLVAAEAAMRRYSLTKVATAAVQNDASDAPAAAATIAAANPEAVLIGLAGKPTISFVKSIRVARKGLPLYALSVAANTLSSLGDDAFGIAVSQVVPLPTNSVVPVVRDFLQAWQNAGVTLVPSHLALEGYINARVFVEAMRRAGRNLTRKAFIDTAWSIKRYDLGGFELNFDQPGRNASRFIELTMIGRSGRFIR
ncbi:ABC transporter substrate-binding protein [Piscinibacter sp.]|uniref:ABC transporter substrate-binding protein n=1 Tax=Piscinibacter sp. TaxID=1903157 RepID=UPI002F3FE487